MFGKVRAEGPLGALEPKGEGDAGALGVFEGGGAGEAVDWTFEFPRDGRGTGWKEVLGAGAADRVDAVANNDGEEVFECRHACGLLEVLFPEAGAGVGLPLSAPLSGVFVADFAGPASVGLVHEAEAAAREAVAVGEFGGDFLAEGDVTGVEGVIGGCLSDFDGDGREIVHACGVGRDEVFGNGAKDAATPDEVVGDAGVGLTVLGCEAVRGAREPPFGALVLLGGGAPWDARASCVPDDAEDTAAVGAPFPGLGAYLGPNVLVEPHGMEHVELRAEHEGPVDTSWGCEVGNFPTRPLVGTAVDMIGRMAQEPTADKLLLSLAQLAIERRPSAEVFGTLASPLVEGARVDYASLLARDADTNTWRVLGIYPHDRERDVGGVPRIRDAEVELLLQHPEGLAYRIEGDSPVEELLRGFGLQWGWSTLLTVEGEVFGVFTVARSTAEPFSEAEQGFLRTAARFLSHALREELRLAIVQRWGSRSRLLNDVSLLLGGGAPVETLFVELASRNREELPLDFLLLFRAVEGRLRASGVYPGSIRPWLHISHQESVWLEEKVAALDAPEVLSVEGLPEGFTKRLEAQGTRRVWFARLQDSGSTLGAVVVGWRSERRPTPTDEWFVQTLAALITQALAREQALARARLEAEQREVLARAAAVAASRAHSEDAVRALVGAVGRVVPRPVIGWAFVGEQAFRVAAGRNSPAATLERSVLPGVPLSGDVVFAFESLPRPLAAAGARSPSVAVVAAASGGELVGHLLVASRSAGFRFDERTVGLVSLVANVVAPALRNARLAEESDRLRRTMEVILQSLSEAILLLDKDVRLVWANAGGRAIADLVDPERRLRGVGAHLPYLTKEAGAALEAALERRERSVGRTSWVVDGRRRVWDFEIVPLDHPEYSVVCVASDVTAEVEANERAERHREEMERASRLAAIGEIVSGVAHELNNPLTSVLGFAELAAQSPAGAGVREELELIRREALRARNIVRDLLFIARPGTPERKPFDLGEVVAHVVRLRESGWRSGGLGYEVDVRVERPVLGSEGHVTQVVLNLVTNAEQALEGRAGARVGVHAWEEDGFAVVEVADNGPGVPAEVRERIFEPFFTTKAGRGTGLGLSLSRSIVESHGGRLWLEDGDGLTRFRFSLPLAEDPVATDDGPARASHAEATGALRVLVVDDEPGIRRMAEQLLLRAGHLVRCAATAADGVAIAQEWRPDAIICDYRLRGETADVVLEGLDRGDERLARRVILMTGATTDRGVAELARRYGLPVLAKPFGKDELLASLAEVTSLAFEGA